MRHFHRSHSAREWQVVAVPCGTENITGMMKTVRRTSSPHPKADVRNRPLFAPSLPVPLWSSKFRRRFEPDPPKPPFGIEPPPPAPVTSGGGENAHLCPGVARSPQFSPHVPSRPRRDPPRHTRLLY